ncbi:MAG TPA: cupin domain-containing protein [Bauldia sp.]|nr:cupin domain-containing protein [Bauldia sp.]
MRTRDRWGQTMRNVYDNLPAHAAAELVDALLARPGIRIERIVSTGQASPEGFWYDQPQGEWVIVLRGAAGLLIEGEAEQRLGPGDFVFLPAHKRHRVTFTAAHEPTVWLAVHFGADVRGGGPGEGFA